MLASFLVYLRPQRRAALGRHVGRSLHGLFFHLLHAADPALAERLHAPLPAKPFTVSPLLGDFDQDGGRLVARPDRRYSVRYTVLTDELFDTLGEELLTRTLAGQPVTVDGTPFDVERLALAPHDRDPWLETSDYAALLRRPPSQEITLHFASPTAFKLGDLTQLFPAPYSVFGSYRRTWDAFAGLPLPDDLMAFVDQHVAVSRYQLETRAIQPAGHTLLGFVGRCTYRVLGDAPDHLRALNALADLALFAGTGMKTTQGLGQTRRVSAERERRA